MNRKEINLLNDAMFKALFRSEEARDIIEKAIVEEYNKAE